MKNTGSFSKSIRIASKRSSLYFMFSFCLMLTCCSPHYTKEMFIGNWTIVSWANSNSGVNELASENAPKMTVEITEDSIFINNTIDQEELELSLSWVLLADTIKTDKIGNLWIQSLTKSELSLIGKSPFKSEDGQEIRSTITLRK
jgi:hypothetical protein